MPQGPVFSSNQALKKMKLYNWQTSYSNWKVLKVDGPPKIGGGGSDFSMNIFGVCDLGQDSAIKSLAFILKTGANLNSTGCSGIHRKLSFILRRKHKSGLS